MSVKHRLVPCKPRNDLSLSFRIKSGPMKFWHAIGVQLLSIVLREQARWSELERDRPVQVSCNCTGAIKDSRETTSNHIHYLWLGVGILVGVGVGIVVTLIFAPFFTCKSNGNPFRSRPRRRGGGVLSLN